MTGPESEAEVSHPVDGSLRILIADDHEPTRVGIRLALERAGLEVCYEASDAAGAVEGALLTHPDGCLLDINMPGSGIAAAAEICERAPEIAVVMLTVSHDEADLFASLQAGASGYLLKEMDPDRLPLALRGVLRGEAALPRPLVARLIEEFRARGQPSWHQILRRRGVSLTSREWETLGLMREGLETSEMAERLDLTPATIRSHIAAILRKLGVPDRRTAVRIAAGRGEISTGE